LTHLRAAFHLLTRVAQVVGSRRALTVNIELGLPCGKGYCERFNGKRREDFSNGEIFSIWMKELRVQVKHRRFHNNTVRPDSSLGVNPPALAVWLTDCGADSYPSPAALRNESNC
jgi:hypothetical protein